MHGMGKSFLNDQFERLVNQTFKDFDVVISDYSKDNEIFELCRQYSTKLNIKYFRNTRYEAKSKMACNANNALDKATGKIIKLIMLDDYLYDNKSLANIKENFDLSEDHWMVTACTHTKDGINYFRPFYPKYNKFIYLGYNTISSPSVLILKNENLPRFDENIFYYVDVDFYKQCFDKFGLPKILNDICVVNRLSDYQASNTEVNDGVKWIEYKYVVRKYHNSVVRLYYIAKRWVRNKFKKYARN